MRDDTFYSILAGLFVALSLAVAGIGIYVFCKLIDLFGLLKLIFQIIF